MSEINNPTFVLLNVSSLDEVLVLSLIRVQDIGQLLETDITNYFVNNNKPLEVLIAIFNNYGVCMNYKKHLITPGIPINMIRKRIYYSLLLLLKDLNLNSIP